MKAAELLSLKIGDELKCRGLFAGLDASEPVLLTLESITKAGLYNFKVSYFGLIVVEQ